MLFPPKTSETLLQLAGRDNLAQMRTASGATEENFTAHYMPLLANFAEFVQELPLEPDTYNQPLGALRFGVTASFLALRLSDQVMFVQGQSHERRTLDPQYRFAAFNACLASTILLINHHLIITVSGKPWSYLSSQPNLFKFAKSGPGYEVGWTRNSRKPSSALGVLALAQFFSAGSWADISIGVTADMCSAINPGCTQVVGETPLAKVVRQGMEKAREIEIKGRAGQYRPPDPSTSAKVDLANIDSASLLSLQQTVEPVIAAPAPPRQDVKPPSLLSPELKAWASYIRSNSEIQGKLSIEEDGTLKFDAKFLQGAGLKGQDIYKWLKEGGFVKAQHSEPTKHLVLTNSIANELKVQA